jgi:dephospho-CoA kinase
MVLGITGGIGSGKTTAAKLFTEFGFERYDSDELIRNRLYTDPEILRELTQRFGKNVVSDAGQVDRMALAGRVFSDDAELAWLEELLHPRLFQIWREILKERAGRPLVFEVPLLFEKGLENWFDFTICVATTSPNQLARLAERGMSHALAEQRISKQLPLAQKIEFADFVLSNDGSLSFLRDQIAKLVSRLPVQR